MENSVSVALKRSEITANDLPMLRAKVDRILLNYWSFDIAVVLVMWSLSTTDPLLFAAYLHRQAVFSECTADKVKQSVVSVRLSVCL